MNSTPLWVPLAVAIVGVLGTVGGTIGGVLLNQRRADKREADIWQRESSREQERWAREDMARTFDERRDAYISFYRANGEAGLRVYEYLLDRVVADRHDGEPPPVFAPEAEEKLTALAIFGTQRVLDLAHEAQTQYRKMAIEAGEWRAVDGTGPLDRRGDEWDLTRHYMLQAMREDLGIPSEEGGETTLPRFASHLARYRPTAD